MASAPPRPFASATSKAGSSSSAAPNLSENLLSSAIRTLSPSSSTQHRENEKAKLDKAFQECDRKLDGLLTQHHQQLTTLIAAFTTISDKLSDSRTRISRIKDNLLSCKSLLHCKRDELRKFWIDSIEQATIVTILENIEAVCDAPEKIELYLEKKYYLHATELLCKSLHLLRHDLKDVEAMTDISAEMEKRREALLARLIDELHRLLYTVSVKKSVMVFKRIGSLRSGGSLQRGSTVPATSRDTGAAAGEPIVEELGGDPDSQPAHLLAIIVECLAMMREVPAAVNAIKQRMASELMEVVRRASQQFVDTAYQQGEVNLALQEQPQYLSELLHLLFEQFRCIAHFHNTVIYHLKRVKNSPSNPYKGMTLYDITEVWSRIQLVLEITLKDYVTEAKSSYDASKVEPAILDTPEKAQRVDVSSYFMKRKGRQKKDPVFQFSRTSHASQLTDYMRDQRSESYQLGDATDVLPMEFSPLLAANKARLVMVCKPAVSNITVVYKMIESFTSEIEMALGLETGACSLHRFVTSFVGNTFMKHIHEKISGLITEETASFDSLKRVVEPRRQRREQRETSIERPLLHSAYTVMECVDQLCELMQDLPDYSHQFMAMLVTILRQYLVSCEVNYQGIVKTSNSDARSVSATWAKDEDISRFLRSLPNWHSLHQQSLVDGDTGGAQAASSTVASITEEEMRALNSKESTILTSNLTSHDAIIPAHDIISDPALLKLLGSMHVSLEWLVRQLRQFIDALPTDSTAYMKNKRKLDIPEVDVTTVQGLEQLAAGLLDLSDTCLLVLHLEVRVHCFYYLMPVAKQSNYFCVIDDMDADQNVLNLNRDLTSIEEVMSQSVQPVKFRYIFDGLGHLVSSLLINSVQYLRKINENGVKKMCRNIFAIQQCLTNVTSSRDSDLDHARRYYELLNLSIEDILRLILEQGARYSELEYLHLFNLLKRSRKGMTDEYFQGRLQKLKDVITEKHVYNV